MAAAELDDTFLESVIFRFQSLKNLGDGALGQLSDKDLHWTPSSESNSIAVLVQHLHGNMLSRWTDFLTSDGEKTWRDRDGEFTPDPTRARGDLLSLWEQGWACLLSTLSSLEHEDLMRDVVIRGQTLSVVDAIHRQVAHYGYHIGQIVLTARMRLGNRWRTLSIPRGESNACTPQRRD